jgi:hypothetical protein
MLSLKDQERFWSKTVKSGNCIIWTAGITGNGYGAFKWNKKMMPAHRISLMMSLGRDILQGLDVAHQPLICHNPLCVNAEHLREAPRHENNADRDIDDTNCKGENNGQAKLTEDDVWAIISDPRKAQDLADEYDIHVQSVRRIRRGERWGWI